MVSSPNVQRCQIPLSFLKAEVTHGGHPPTVNKKDLAGFGMVGPVIVVGERHGFAHVAIGDVEDLSADI